MDLARLVKRKVTYRTTTLKHVYTPQGNTTQVIEVKRKAFSDPLTALEWTKRLHSVRETYFDIAVLEVYAADNLNISALPVSFRVGSFGESGNRAWRRWFG